LDGNAGRLAEAGFNATRMKRDAPGLAQELPLAKGLCRD